MVAASGMELIKGSNIKDTPESPGYTRILTKQQQEESGEGDQFVRFMPDGSLSIFKKEKVEVVPEIDIEEVNRRRLEQLEREVYQKAFEEGEKTGIEIGQEKMEQEIHRIIPQLESVLRELDNLPHRVFTASENFLIESLLSFNRELLAHELSVNPEGVADRVRRILDHAVGRKDIVIRVSPSNAQILERMGQFDKLKIVSDPGVASGSVVMESDFGGMEDNIEARLREVETALRQQLQERLDKSGIVDIADAARNKADMEKNAELEPLIEDNFKPEAEEQQADEKDGLNEEEGKEDKEALAAEEGEEKDALADEESLPSEDILANDDALAAAEDLTNDDILATDDVLADNDGNLDDFLDDVAESQGHDDQLDSQSDDIIDDLLDSSPAAPSHEEAQSPLENILDDDYANQDNDEDQSSLDSLLDSDGDITDHDFLADDGDDGFLDSGSDFVEQDTDMDSSEPAPPAQDDDEWLALAEGEDDGDATDSFFEQDELLTPTDEDQKE
ncbi:MAG: hypothetical protein HQL69_11185 [Magnetococcales bacterium]|nr:hypothetical protein [Magnetococcales bacterium]